jgi:hypothetical protein
VHIAVSKEQKAKVTVMSFIVDISITV